MVAFPRFYHTIDTYGEKQIQNSTPTHFSTLISALVFVIILTSFLLLLFNTRPLNLISVSLYDDM